MSSSRKVSSIFIWIRCVRGMLYYYNDDDNDNDEDHDYDDIVWPLFCHEEQLTHQIMRIKYQFVARYHSFHSFARKYLQQRCCCMSFNSRETKRTARVLCSLTFGTFWWHAYAKILCSHVSRWRPFRYNIEPNPLACLVCKKNNTKGCVCFGWFLVIHCQPIV